VAFDLAVADGVDAVGDREAGPDGEREQRRQEGPEERLLSVAEGVPLVGRERPRRAATTSSTSLTVSPKEWAASESMADDPLSTPASSFARAMPRLAAPATNTVTRLSLVDELTAGR
jgi:hypothetical protein